MFASTSQDGLHRGLTLIRKAGQAIGTGRPVHSGDLIKTSGAPGKRSKRVQFEIK